MISFLSSWVKNIGLAIVIVSILEMLLPNNKIKKYIRTVMGVYILFNIISPIIQNKDIFDVNKIDLESYVTANAESVNQATIDNRIENLYVQELKKDLNKKLEDLGYEISNCKVNVVIGSTEEDTKINKIEFTVVNKIEKKQEKNIENTIVSEIQKIKKVDAQVKEDKEKINNTDKQNIKKFLIEEYGVSEECLKIN